MSRLSSETLDQLSEGVMSFITRVISKLLRNIKFVWYRSSGPSFECPICGYMGRFNPVAPQSGGRKYAQCPQCNALERHRLQFLVLDSLLKTLPCSTLSMLHVAPEPFLSDFFRPRFARYDTADLSMAGVDYQVDLTALPFADASYDLVFASHVLEHIQDDMAALAEIRRVLKPGGIAVLPVPLLSRHTIEYSVPNPAEAFHVRAPGQVDYFERYLRFFSRVEVITSDDLPAKHQLYIYEDRSQFPSEACPKRPAMVGARHVDAVPICYV
jgi:SAM-dependent methyltransferase